VHEIQPQPKLADYLTVGEAAEFLGVSPWTLRNWDKGGKLRTLRHPKNGYRIYRRKDLEAVLQPGGFSGRLSNRLTPSADWSEVGESEHLVQFYESDTYLINSVSQYLGAALGAGDGAVLVATRPHRSAIQRKLRARGLDLHAARSRGQFVSLDATETLAKFMVGGTPDRASFRDVIGEVIVQAAGDGRRVRAFGEMVALLWADGAHEAAIHLEELWTDLQETHTFTLYCAYPIDGFGDAGHETPFESICTCHCRVLPTESYAALAQEDKRLQAIARLQQKAQALEAEIAHRTEVEARLIALRKQQEAELADLKRLHEMSTRLSTGRELAPILEETLHTAAALSDTDLGLLSLCDGEQEGLKLGASLGFDDGFLRLVEYVPPGEGACGTCLRERRRVVVEDVETDPRFGPYREAARRGGFRAIHSTPLVTRSGRVIGVLSTHFRKPHRPSDREMHLIDLCARQAVDSIENARLYRRAQEEIAERQRAEAALREADRRKDQFLATLAHEMRNPLAPVRNALQIMRLAGDDPVAAEQARDMIERQVQQMVRLVDDLLDISRITRGKVALKTERVGLSSVVADAVETSRPLIEAARHELTVSLPADPIELEADPTRLAQVLSNLLNNAAKYTDPGGRIRLSAGREVGGVTVRVRDTGIGIAPEMLPRIFDLFVQADRSGQRGQGGLGIGLTLVRTLVEMHGGTVEAHSGGPGQGSEFIVRLPLTRTQQPSSPEGNGQDSPAPELPPRRVLVVDDHVDAAQSLAMLMRILGQDVRTAHDGSQALREARDFQPQVAFLDIGLPGMTGYDLARRFRDQPGGDKVLLVALTGWGQEEDRRRAREAGFNEHLTKPVEPSALEELLARAG
jgi:signal transduction histidine kinase